MSTTDLRRERERQRRDSCRETIVRAAERVILRKGFSAATMDDVAREAQFSKATLYKYVPSKGALLFEILGHYFGEIRRAMEGIEAESASAIDKLRRSIRLILEYNADKENITRVLWMDNATLKVLRVFVGTTPRSSPVKAYARRMMAVLHERRREVMEIGARIVEEGVASGELRPLDPRAAVAFIEAVVQGYTHMRFWGGERSRPAADAERLTHFILDGIRNPDRPEKES